MFFYFCKKQICISSIRGIWRPDLQVPPEIEGAKLAGSPSDFSTPPPTSCWSINSNISLWPHGGKTPCVLVLCGVHVAISGCVYAAPRLEKQAKLELYATGAQLLCKNNGSYGDFCFYSFPFHSRVLAFTHPHRSRAAIWWNRPRHKWHLSTSYLWPINICGEGFGCVNEVISARGWKIDVCVWCCCRFVWNGLSGGGLAAVPTHDATDRKSVFLWTRAFHWSLADPSFCLLLLRRLSLFWKIFGSLWNTGHRYYVFWH